MIYSVQDMVTRVVQLLGEGTSNTTDPNDRLYYTQITSNLNLAYQKLNQDAKRKKKSELLNYINFSVTDSSTGATGLRFVPFLGEVVGITKRVNTSSSIPTQEEFAIAYYSWQQGYSQVRMENYSRFSDGAIRIVNGKGHQDWRLWYVRTPPPLQAGTLSAGTATTLTFPSAPTYGSLVNVDNVNVGDPVKILSGDASGQVGVITAYDWATRVATMGALASTTADAFSAAPGTATYSTMPWFDPNFYELLPLMAARYYSKEAAAQDHDMTMAALYADYMNWLGRNDRLTPPQVVNGGNVPSGMEPGGWGPYAYNSTVGWSN